MRAFSLIEMLCALIIVGMLGALASASFLHFQKFYYEQTNTTHAKIQTLNTLTQIKNILKEAIYPSILIKSSNDEMILRWLPKIDERVSYDGVSALCFHGFYYPHIKRHDGRLFIKLWQPSQDFSQDLLQALEHCKLYSNTQSLSVLFVPSHAHALDFYDVANQAALLSLHPTQIITTIPPSLKGIQKASLGRLFLAKPAQELIYKQGQILLKQYNKPILLAKAITHFSATKQDFGIKLKLCLMANEQDFCAQNVVLAKP